MIKKLIFAIFFILLPCHSMTAEEAVLRCKESIKNAENIHKELKNDAVRNITQITISLMQKILEALHKGPMKNIPDIIQQCTQYEKHVIWLKQVIDPEIKKNTPKRSESKIIFLDTNPSSEEMSLKKPGKNTRNRKQQLSDSRILRKVLKKQKINKSGTTL